jgi:hypothetical protein
MGRRTYAPWTAQRFCRFAGGHGACFPDRVTLNWNWTMLGARQESSVRVLETSRARETRRMASFSRTPTPMATVFPFWV